MKKIILFVLFITARIVTIDAQVMPCYDSYVYSSFSNLTPQLDNTSYMFMVPIAFTPQINGDVFKQPGFLERKNLWNAEVRIERYEYVLMDLVLLSNYEPAKIRAMQEEFLDRAPALVKSSILYPLLQDYLLRNIELNKKMSEISSAYQPIRDLSKVISGLTKIGETLAAPSSINSMPVELVEFFGSENLYPLLDPGTWAVTRNWLKSFSNGAKVASLVGSGLTLSTAYYNIISTVFFSQILANEAALSRLTDFEACVGPNSSLYRDPAFTEALNNIKIFLNESRSEKMFQTTWNSIKDNSTSIASGSINLIMALCSANIISALEGYALSAGCTVIKAAHIGGLWGLGLFALQQEFLIILGINQQLVNSELAACYATVAYDLCLHSNGNCKLRVPIMYGFVRSAENIVKLCDYSTIPFYNPNAQVKAIWEGITTDFKIKLNEQAAISCIPAPGILTSGKVAPVSGTPDDNYIFSIIYVDRNTNPQSPSEVILKFDNQSLPMQKRNASDSNYNLGVEYIYTLSKPTIGSHNYSFTAKDYLGTSVTPYPVAGSLILAVQQNVAGWDIIANSITLSTLPKPGQTFNITCTALNNSNSSDKIYSNIPWSMQMISPTGAVVQSSTGTIISLSQGQTSTITKTFTAPSTEEVYQLIFTINPLIDGNYGNNSYSRTLTVSSTGPQLQWNVNPSDAWILMTTTSSNNPYPFASSTWKYLGNNSSAAKFNRNSSTTIYSINNEDFRTFDNNSIILINEANNGSAQNFMSFGTNGTERVVFDQTNGTCLPGEKVTFIGTASGTTFNGSSPDIYKQTTVASWNTDLVHVSSTQEKYIFTIPSSTTPGTYDFYLGARVGGTDGRFIRQMRITILNPPPSITLISKSKISADDIITITGINFGNSGTVSFGGINSGNILSWTNTSIQCAVPVGISKSTIQIINSFGSSNLFPYDVLSSTGNPVTIFSIPTQFLNPGETIIVADLDDVFMDPNGTTLTYLINTNNAKISYDASAIVVDNTLKLISASDLLTGSSISVTATDASGKQTTQSFQVEVPSIINLSSYILELESVASNSKITVSSNISWSVSKSESWVSFTISNNEITIALLENKSASPRTSSIKVTGNGIVKDVILDQKGAIPELLVDKSSISIGAASGSSEQFTIKSNTLWNLTSDVSWVTMSTNINSDNAIVTVAANETNPTNNSRIATLTIRGNGINNNTVSVVQTGSPITIIDKILNYCELSIYPNPFKEHLHLKIEGFDAINLNISLVNESGQILYREEIHQFESNKDKVLNFSSFKKGMYILNLKSDMINKSYKIIKE